MLHQDRNHRSFRSLIAHIIMSIVVVVAISMPLFQSYYIYPRFIDLIIQNTEGEAIRTGRHLMRLLMKGYEGGNLSISNEMLIHLDNASKDYDLWKIKIFDAGGKTLYSTAGQDVGQRNQHTYFHEIVAKGFVHTNVVKKDTVSMEGQTVSNDVVETYIPIFNRGEFLGAFELYYNISIQKGAMDAIIDSTNLLIYSLTAIIVLAAIWAGIGIRRGMRIRKRYEEALYANATKDALTGVYNRRRLNELLEWEVEKYIRYKKNASLLMIDIDYFKAVNDTYGHQAGDDVLVTVSRTIQTILRKCDFISRYGGEEFVVLLPGTGKQNALGVAEKVRQKVKAASTPNDADPIQVTVSIGVVDFREVASISFERVIKLADDCLYKAKGHGRDRVCTSDELLKSRPSDSKILTA